jgi:hypothetical protein
MRASLTQPALVGGVVMGVLSALPIVSVGNACCCLWVVSGGIIAAYMLQQNQTIPITPGDGALVGLLAGLFGALVQAVLSVPITLVVGPMERELVQRILDMAGNIPPDLRDALERYSRGGGRFGLMMLVSRMIAFMFWVCVGAVFSTLGGLLGAAMFRKPGPPPGTIEVPPTNA